MSNKEEKDEKIWKLEMEVVDLKEQVHKKARKINKFLLKFKWYRMKHLDKFIPDKYKTIYENIQRGIPNSLQDTIAVCNIVEKVKAGVIDE